MKKVTFLVFSFCCFSFSSGPKQKCPSFAGSHPVQKNRWVKQSVIRHRIIFIDMGGVSISSYQQEQSELFPGGFHYLPGETKKDRERQVKNVISGTIWTYVGPNGEPLDISCFSSSGDSLYHYFGKKESEHLPKKEFSYKNPRTITFKVWSSGTLNTSPCAFETRIWLDCYIQGWEWVKVKNENEKDLAAN